MNTVLLLIFLIYCLCKADIEYQNYEVWQYGKHRVKDLTSLISGENLNSRLPRNWSKRGLDVRSN